MTEFIPGPPKMSMALTPPMLETRVCQSNKIKAAKNVGDGVVIVYMTGTHNYYLNDCPELRDVLARYEISIC